MTSDIGEQSARALIAAESIDTMTALAERYVFGDGKRPPIAFIHFMNRIQTITLIRGSVPTSNLVAVVAADLEIGERQAYRLYRQAVEDGWILPQKRKSRGDGSNNKHHPDINFSDKILLLHKLKVKIGKIAALQYADPFNTTAGIDLLSNNERKIYMHPLTRVERLRQQRKKDI